MNKDISAVDMLAERLHITKEEALNKMKAAMGIKKVSCSHTDAETVKEWLPQYEGKWMAESED